MSTYTIQKKIKQLYLAIKWHIFPLHVMSPSHCSLTCKLQSTNLMLSRIFTGGCLETTVEPILNVFTKHHVRSPSNTFIPKLSNDFKFILKKMKNKIKLVQVISSICAVD